jgi:lipopolysaccharide transport system ATP-binding protein
MPTAIEFENISKEYRLGLVSTQTLSHDLNRWWKMNVLGKEDPYMKIGEVNDRAHKGVSDYIWALKDINFEVEQGDVLGIIGKNGAGKSTLLKILSKVTTPTTGTIKARGRIASLLEVGTGFHPEMTGRENIFMNGAIMGMTKREITNKLDEIVDFSGVERYIDTPTKRYSSGMTVRLGFAIAAHLDPEILVVDEVLAVGDFEFQKKAIGKMQDISKGEGRTVLFVSHNMGSITTLCKKGIVLNNGTIDFSGNIQDAVSFYQNKDYNFDENQQIVDHIIRKHSDIIINQILINGQGSTRVHLKPNENILKIHLEGELKSSKKIALEVYISDDKAMPLAIFNPCLAESKIQTYEKGEFILEETLILPEGMMSGNYYAAMSLTYPNVEGYVDISRCICIETEGFVTDMGFSYDYSREHGWLFLK